jgi:3-phenylpropionate/trans-cinnamate dioxygenase ferredoxin component
MPQAVARTSEIPHGSTKRVEIDGVPVLLCNVGGTFYAVEDICTHDGEPLDASDLDGQCITCPRHGATFDVTTGRALTLPAFVPLPTYDVRVDGDEIVVTV